MFGQLYPNIMCRDGDIISCLNRMGMKLGRFSVLSGITASED